MSAHTDNERSEAAVDVPRLVRCIDCKYWVADPKIDWEQPLKPPADEWRDGQCCTLQYELEIDLHTGWEGGTVREIRTVATFFCAYAEPRPSANRVLSPTPTFPISGPPTPKTKGKTV